MHTPRPANGDGTHSSCDGVSSTLCNWELGIERAGEQICPQRTPFRLNPVELPLVELSFRGLRLVALEETGQVIGFLRTGGQGGGVTVGGGENLGVGECVEGVVNPAGESVAARTRSRRTIGQRGR